MANSTFYQASFIGGEWSQSAQGALPDPRYKLSMSTCLNGLPTETGAWCRRPGFEFAATTRLGVAGKLIPFTFKENAPYNMEFTDGYLRFYNGASLVKTNDAQAVVSISTENPARVTTINPHGWSNGQSVVFSSLGSTMPVLHNRVFGIVVSAANEVQIYDPITTATIDGATLGSFTSGNVARVLEIVTEDTNGRWTDLRSIQAESETVLVRSDKAPRLLSVLTKPSGSAAATFDLTNFNFRDGPYLDPIAGSILTASALNGTVTVTLSTQAYDSTKAYNADDFVTTIGVTYKSLVDNNQNHTPASSPTFWLATTAGGAIGPNGFISSDIGRQVRMYSEPPLYSASSAYVSGQTVSFPSTVAGVNVYYTATGAVAAGAAPGTSLLWSLTPTVARWTWGRVQSVSGTGLITPVSAFGTFSNPSNAFNGTTGQPFASSASVTTAVDTAPVWSYSSDYTSPTHVYFAGSLYFCTVDHRYYTGFLCDPGGIVISSGFYWRCLKRNLVSGQFVAPIEGEFWTSLGGGQPTNGLLWNFIEIAPYTAGTASVGQAFGGAKAISQATVYPASDIGFANSNSSITLNLRAKNGSPSTPADGVLLGTSGAFTNTLSPITIVSTDQVSTYTNVWIEFLSNWVPPLPSTNNSFTIQAAISQIQFYQPNVNNGSVITVQIEGPPLLYLSAVTTWRLGVYSDTTGWPTCGVYHEGRLWLSGAVDNRVDSSKVGKINEFSPTSDYGAVSDDNAISYTLDATDVNAVFWMAQDQQGIICGTQAGEWLIQASTLNSPLTPTNMQAHRVTTIGCANIEPRRSDHTLLFVQKHGRKVMEYFADVFSGKFSSPNLSKDAKHLTVGGVAEIAWQQELVPTLWARRNDGQLVGMTYKRDSLTTSQGPTANGWHRHSMGSGRLVESLCVGPSTDGTLDSVSVITNDPVTGIRHVEVMTDLFEETNIITDAWQLDDAVTPSSYATATVSGGAPGVTFTGLWHLNAKTVTIFAGGLDLGDWPVSSGSAQVPFSPSSAGVNALFTAAFVAAFNGAMPVVIGFSFVSQGQMLPPDTQPESGARNGPGFAKIRRMHKFGASLVATQGISFGTSFNRLHPALLKTPGGTALLAANTLYSGTIKDTIADDAQGYESQLCWQIGRPFPAMVAGAGGFLQTTDE